MTTAPTSAFSGADLDIATVLAGEPYRRIWLASYPDPLGYGKGRSRFSDPRRRIESNRFGVLYLGSSLKVCFLEAILRDQRDGLVGTVPLGSTILADRAVAAIVPTRDLKLLDLRGDAPVRMSVPSDVAGGSNQTLARVWSGAFHEHPQAIDGIIRPGSTASTTSSSTDGRSRRSTAPAPCHCSAPRGWWGVRRVQSRARLIGG